MVTWPLVAKRWGGGWEIEYQLKESKNHCIWSSYTNHDWLGSIATLYNLGAPLAEKGDGMAKGGVGHTTVSDIVHKQKSQSSPASLRLHS